MHELGIAEAALQQALEHSRRAGGSRVARIVLRVGELSGVDPEALRFAFAALQPGTAAEAAVLEIDAVHAVVRCQDCAREFRPGDPFAFACPSCQRICTEVARGRELELTSLEIE